MQSRPAIVLSLGMLLEKVDTSGFIGKLLKKAKDENAEFVFAPELQKQAFLLSETFNQGKIESDTFKTRLLKLLGIESMQSSEFWSEWDNMITLGDLVEKIQQLQDVGHRHNALVYLSSDTNLVHLKKIAKESEAQNIILDTSKQPMMFGQFPLYVSCRVGKNRQELTEHIVGDIRAKEINKPDAITLILGNPDNVKDKSHQAAAKRECETIAAWCDENNVSIKLHNNVLSETLDQIFSPKQSNIDTAKLAVNM